MSFEDKLKSLGAKAESIRDLLETEEATKNALVMPFIATLGYDVFDPTEVIPEFTADVGTKKGEKVDYVIKRDDTIVMLIEAKKVKAELNLKHSNQLFRYFTTTKARIAVLTNGILYRFYSDLEEPNKMDSKPFLELNLLQLRESLINEVGKLSKSRFDLENMLATASDLKYMREIRSTLEKQFEEPSEDFVRFFFNQANPNGRFVQSAKEQFAQLVKRTLSQFISDRVSDRLRTALAREDASLTTEKKVDTDNLPPEPVPKSSEQSGPQPQTAPSTSGSGIVTTDEELEGFRIIKAIVSETIRPERVTIRDSKSYCSVIVDNNNRQPIARLHFNRTRKYVGTFDTQKKETKHHIENLQGIYALKEQLREIAVFWRGTDKSPVGAPESSKN